MLKARYLCGAKCVLVSVMLLTMTACSGARFFYNKLDTLIDWYVDDYVTLSREQSADFQNRVDQLLEWHRREELPAYTQLLTDFERSLDPSLDEQSVATLFDELSVAADRLEVRILDLMIEFGATLSLAQREEFMLALEEEQEEQRDRLLSRSDEAYQSNVQDQFADNLSRFLGRLTGQQKETLAFYSGDYQRFDGVWIEDRARWTEELAAVIASNTANWPSEVRDILAGREAARSPEYVAVYAHNQALSQNIVTEVINQRTPKQDRRLRRKINNYREDFIALAAEAEPFSPAVTSP
ncbi:MAG: DUF6279 family lipoprotein [Luminiphilus sp.]|nr:DUF6279 family lipoprotein [Luminiphilus sp.]MDG1460037.1 DUF6279 family lipoprotein [Luminiphilus sp.]